MDNLSKIPGPDALRVSDSPQQKKPDPTLTVGTVARGLKALDPKDLVTWGADRYNDPLNDLLGSRPTNHEEQIKARSGPLGAVYLAMAQSLAQPLSTADIFRGNQLVFQVPFNGKVTNLIITPSLFTNSIDIQIEGGGSENVSITVQELIFKIMKWHETLVPESVTMSNYPQERIVISEIVNISHSPQHKKHVPSFATPKPTENVGASSNASSSAFPIITEEVIRTNKKSSQENTNLKKGEPSKKGTKNNDANQGNNSPIESSRVEDNGQKGVSIDEENAVLYQSVSESKLKLIIGKISKQKTAERLEKK